MPFSQASRLTSSHRRTEHSALRPVNEAHGAVRFNLHKAMPAWQTSSSCFLYRAPPQPIGIDWENRAEVVRLAESRFGQPRLRASKNRSIFRTQGGPPPGGDQEPGEIGQPELRSDLPCAPQRYTTQRGLRYTCKRRGRRSSLWEAASGSGGKPTASFIQCIYFALSFISQRANVLFSGSWQMTK